jgi:muconolactone delta-isomerase
MLPPAVARQLMEASLEWAEHQKKTGKLLEIHSMPGGRTMAICEHASAEDLEQTLASLPLNGYMHFEVYPLSDFSTSLKAHIESMRAAEKMFPAKEMAGVR